MKIVVLDSKTLGDDLSLEPLMTVGECTIYDNTSPEEVAERIADCDVVIINKIKLSNTNLSTSKNLKLICVAATGYDNIDIEYCKASGIAVCNVIGYSSNSVAQVTASMVLSLSIHMNEYCEFVNSGEYSASGTPNRLVPVYHELYGKTWGIVGLGNIGKQVARIASALGCRVIACKRTPEEGYECVDIDTLCRESDVITLHTPLNDSTRGIIDERRLSLMKKEVILVNAARGAITDEVAVAAAVKNGSIAAFGTDVYSVEPIAPDHPFNSIMEFPNVILTPHMAWGAYEARVRCLNEIIKNIKCYFDGKIRNRVDL